MTCAGGLGTKLQVPKDTKKTRARAIRAAACHASHTRPRTVGLCQPFLVLQLIVPAAASFSFELRLTTTSRSHMRLNFSTSFKDVEATPLHVKVPLTHLPKGQWLNLVLDCASFVSRLSPGAAFQFIDSVTVGAACSLRRLFTLRQPPAEADASLGGACSPLLVHALRCMRKSDTAPRLRSGTHRPDRAHPVRRGPCVPARHVAAHRGLVRCGCPERTGW